MLTKEACTRQHFQCECTTVVKSCIFLSVSSVTTHTLPLCYHCHSLEVDLKQVRNGWLWFLRNSNYTNRQLHTFHAVLLAFMFQVGSKGQDQTQNILYAHPVCLQYLNKNIIQHDDSQRPEERTRDSSLKVMYDMKYIPSNNTN